MSRKSALDTALVVGYGSIGARHARILRELGTEVEVVSRRANAEFPRHAELAEALEKVRPNYVVLSNHATERCAGLDLLAELGFNGVVLAEKPLFAVAPQCEISWPFRVFVGYNLRFHPLLQMLRDALRAEELVSLQVYAGQYLPQWRPDADYRSGYAARRESGGGVLRDLSHELDYVQWLGGNWQSVAARGGHWSELEIETDDCFGLLVQTAHCPLAMIQVNYLDRVGRRHITAQTQRHTFRVELESGLFWNDGEKTHVPVERDESYRRQHEALLSRDFEDACSLQSGVETLRLIEAGERAAWEKSWIMR